MTKDQEINILKSTIEQLGNDSYLGPWLRAQLPEIESSLASDLLPVTSREIERRAQRTADDAVSLANAEAGRIVAVAQREASNLVNKAKSERFKAGEQLMDLARSLERAARNL